MKSKTQPEQLIIHKTTGIGWSSDIASRAVNKHYAHRVLDAFDRLEHQEKRQQLDLKSSVERAARNRL